MAKHIPGPWAIMVTEDSFGRGNYRLCGSEVWRLTREELLANAKLMEAAPELLEALQDLVQQIQNKGIAANFAFDLVEKALDTAEAD